MRRARKLLAILFACVLALMAARPVLAAVPVAPSNLQVGGFPGGEIRLGWTDNSTNEISFQVERSVNDRLHYSLLVTLPPDTTTYTDTPVTPDLTYWYRVRACSGEGCSAYSKDSFSIAMAAGSVPNWDERYALFLVNESRSDPAAYGYSSYAPRAPLAYNPLLNYAAHSHSQAILNSDGTISHCYPDPPDSQPETEYRCPTERARDVGFIGGVSENIILYTDGWLATATIHQIFMDSPGHRENILDSSAREAGFGHTYDPSANLVWHGQYTYNFSGVNMVSIPALPSGVVVPYWGRDDTPFTFQVNFYNSGGTAPTKAQVVIDGVAHNLTLRHGTASNGSYVFTTLLPTGTHDYYFAFEYGGGTQARLPASGSYSGPDVGVGAAVLEVPGEFPTLTDALAYAFGDVTVRLAEGTYAETTPIVVPAAGVWIQGAGMYKTIIQGDGSGHVLEAHVDTQISDLTLTGGGLDNYFSSGLWTTSGHVEVNNCRITGNRVGIFSYCFAADCGARVKVTNSVLDHNQQRAVDANQYPVHVLVNNTVAQNGSGIALGNAASRVENSIIVHNTQSGLIGNDPAATVRYNDVWGNGRGYEDLLPGTGDLAVDPLFVSEAANNYHLQAGSPCINAGNPDPTFNDIDGTRNDMGAYGGPNLPQTLFSVATSPPATDRAFPVTLVWTAINGLKEWDVQYQVGTEGAWQDWLSNITGSTTVWFGPTDPIAPLLGDTYCFRSRARDLVGMEETYPEVADTCTRMVAVERAYLPIILRRAP